MSAFLCSPKHIGTLARYAADNQIYVGDYDPAMPTASKIAKLLAVENIKSINHRYPDTVEGGAAASFLPEITDDDKLYIQVCQDQAKKPLGNFSPVEIIKLAICLDYQSCEHPEWENSDADKFLQVIESKAIRKLPGYESAPWGL